MADKVYTANADSTGTAVVTVEHGRPGVTWIVWQLSVESKPVRNGVNATVKRNASYLTSTIVGGGSTAQGPPAIILHGSDVLTVTWTNLKPNDEAVLTLYLEETHEGHHGSGFGLV